MWHNLGLLYERLGDFDRATNILLKCIEEKKKISGENFWTVVSMNSLAGVYASSGQYASSENIYSACLEYRKAALGDDHVDTLATMNDIAILYTSQKRYDEAEILFLSCLGRAADTEVFHSTIYMSNLGLMYVDQDKYNDALPLLSDCVERRRALLGAYHPHTERSEELYTWLLAKATSSSDEKNELDATMTVVTNVCTTGSQAHIAPYNPSSPSSGGPPSFDSPRKSFNRSRNSSFGSSNGGS